jgi:hypothetical protein
MSERVLHSYSPSRCRDGWRIHARDSRGRLVDSTQKILFRDGFQRGLLRFIEWYGAELEGRADFQRAFIRKFDDLCV